MIDRYRQSDISEIWSDESKFENYLKIEKELASALVEKGVLDHQIIHDLDLVKIDLERIQEIEKITGHDFIAFCHSVEEQISSKSHWGFHYGVTSSDIIDTSQMLQLKKSNDLISQEMELLIQEIDKQINQTSDLLCVGRTHGIYAEPMIFAQKWMGHKAELLRRQSELKNFIFSGQISGAVGTYSILSPDVEKKVLDKLGLDREIVTTQVIPRDRVLSYVQIISNLSLALERMAIEFRHLQHSDVSEVFEGFETGQRGSSVMPHKRNPIGFENITGISRLIRAYLRVAEDNCLLWHERDLSHSSNERIYISDMLGLIIYSIRRTRKIIVSLVYDRKNIEEKVFAHPELLSSQLLHRELVDSERPRSEIYKEIQDGFLRTGNQFKPFFANRTEFKEFYQNKFRDYLRRSV